MKNFFSLIFLGLLVATQLNAQDVKKVAILDVVDRTGNVSEMRKMIVRSNISTAITNTPGYESLERLELSTILDEHNFQRTGYVSNEQIKKLGEMYGADYVLIAEMAAEGNELFISARIVNVETSKRSNEARKLTTTETKQLMSACEELAEQLLGEASAQSGVTKSSNVFVLQTAKLMVQKKDLGSYSAKDANRLGKASMVDGYTDWRLPTRDELLILYMNRDAIGGFQSGEYWASDTKDQQHWSNYSPQFGRFQYTVTYQYSLDFTTGSELMHSNSDQAKYNVRLVRSIE